LEENIMNVINAMEGYRGDPVGIDFKGADRESFLFLLPDGYGGKRTPG
jgi:hypothetical protein